jgi:hypothetical protein
MTAKAKEYVPALTRRLALIQTIEIKYVNGGKDVIFAIDSNKPKTN